MGGDTLVTSGHSGRAGARLPGGRITYQAVELANSGRGHLPGQLCGLDAIRGHPWLWWYSPGAVDANLEAFDSCFLGGFVTASQPPQPTPLSVHDRPGRTAERDGAIPFVRLGT
jgi:hypothetical protein